MDANFKLKMRIEFAKNQKRAFSELQTALDKGDLDTAHLIAHTLRGVSALIGEMSISNLAAEIERCAKRKEIPSKDDLETLQTELNDVLESIEIPEYNAAESWESIDLTATTILLDKLESSLEKCSPDCFDLVDEIAILPDMATIVCQIDNCDFVAAYASLKAMRKELNL